MRPYLPCYLTIQRPTKKRNYRLVFLMNTHSNFFKTKTLTHWKDYLPQSNNFHSMNGEMVQHMKTEKHNIPHKQTERKKATWSCHSMQKRPLTKSATLHDKSPGKIRDTSNIIKVTYSKLIANTNLNREKLKREDKSGFCLCPELTLWHRSLYPDPSGRQAVSRSSDTQACRKVKTVKESKIQLTPQITRYLKASRGN